MNGIFDRAAAAALGRFSHPDTDLMDAVLHDRVHDLRLPVLVGLPLGHDRRTPPSQSARTRRSTPPPGR